ncbi:MAG: hypothetical protein U0599_10990 [Vicinamibacteria bacterium]
MPAARISVTAALLPREAARATPEWLKDAVDALVVAALLLTLAALGL